MEMLKAHEEAHFRMFSFFLLYRELVKQCDGVMIISGIISIK